MWGVQGELTPQADETSPKASPASDTEPPKKQGRSNEFWLAAIGMAGTLLAAIAGGVATYLSGVEHDNHETANTQASFTQASKTAQSSFTQSQQVQAYSTFLSAVNDFITSWDSEMQTVVNIYNPSWKPSPQFPSPPSFSAKYDEVTSYHNFFDAALRLEFFSSKDVKRAVDNVTAKVNDMNTYLAGLKYHPEGTHPSPLDADFVKKYDTLFQDLQSARDVFICAARKDLGAALCETLK
jgi:hypothetical protein